MIYSSCIIDSANPNNEALLYDLRRSIREFPNTLRCGCFIINQTQNDNPLTYYIIFDDEVGSEDLAATLERYNANVLLRLPLVDSREWICGNLREIPTI